MSSSSSSSSSSSGNAPAANSAGGWNWATLSRQASAQNASVAAESQQRVIDRVRQAATETANRRPPLVAPSATAKPSRPVDAKKASAPSSSPSNSTVDDAKEADRERFSGLRIAERTISADELAGEMTGRRFIRLREMDSIPRDVLTDEKTDWVTIGVVARKTLSKATSNGSTFMVWGLSDLDTTELGVFLFDAAYESHWRELEGSIVAILNATVMPASEKNRFALKASRPEEVVKLGRAVDFGICKAMTSAENRCRLAVNTATSQYCMHHIASNFMAAGKRRQQLNNTAATFHKSLFGAKNQVKNISAGVYGVRPTGATSSNNGWQPIITNKRKRDSGSSQRANVATLGVPTVLSATGGVAVKRAASSPAPTSAPAPTTVISASALLNGTARPSGSRGQKLVASLLASSSSSATQPSTSSTAAVLLGQKKRKKVDMIKFMRGAAE
ncbi:hypothetical protein PINS_up000625 [Pythium insidiosum]|nr:hypothetical protein PINS_up000625 [Pythium insidiosum]